MCNLLLQNYSSYGHPGKILGDENCDSFHEDHSEITCRDPDKRRFSHRYLPGYCPSCLDQDLPKYMSKEKKAALDAFLRDMEDDRLGPRKR